MKRVLLVSIPDWETDSLVIDRPPGSKAALVSAKGRVLHATIAARDFGVKTGMKRALAEYLCPDLEVLPDDPARSSRAFNTILDALDEVSPNVSVIRPGIAWFPVTASKNYRSELSFAEHVIDLIAQRSGAECSVGVGDTILSAWVGATTGKVNPDKRIVEETNLTVLKPLIPGAQVEIEEDIKALEALGAYTVADLRAIGTGHILARFGAVGKALHRLLEQKVPTTSLARAEDDYLEEELDFSYPVPDLSLVLGHLLDQSNQLVKRLVDRQVATSAVDIKAIMSTPDGEIERVRTWAIIDFPTPRDLVDRTRWQVQSWIDTISRQAKPDDDYSQEQHGVKTIILSARSLSAIDTLAKRLWGNRSEEDTRAASTAFRLQSLVGVAGVQSMRVRAGYDPVTRVVQTTWGEVGDQAAWETWKLPLKWSDHATFLKGERWAGGLVGESPATVLDKTITVDLLDEGNESVRLREDASLTGTPRHIVLEHDGKGLWRALEIPAGESLYLEQVRGPWPILGRWWDSAAGAEGARAWLIVKPQNAPRMLVGWLVSRWNLFAMWY